MLAVRLTLAVALWIAAAVLFVVAVGHGHGRGHVCMPSMVPAAGLALAAGVVFPRAWLVRRLWRDR